MLNDGVMYSKNLEYKSTVLNTLAQLVIETETEIPIQMACRNLLLAGNHVGLWWVLAPIGPRCSGLLLEKCTKR